MPDFATCRDCHRKWTSLKDCHCVECHRHFGGERAFTMHQGSDGCINPETAVHGKRSKLLGKPLFARKESSLGITYGQFYGA